MELKDGNVCYWRLRAYQGCRIHSMELKEVLGEGVRVGVDRMNPFNGIESYESSRETRLAQARNESIQWN